MSQTVLVQCPHCRAEGNLADPALFGKAISCPVCQQIFTAPVPPASVPPVEAVPAAIEPVAEPAADLALAAAVSPPNVDPIPTPSSAEHPANSSPVEPPAVIEATSPPVAVEPTPGDAPPLDNSVVAAAPVAVALPAVAVVPPEPLASAEAVADPAAAEAAMPAPSAALNPAVQVELVPGAEVAAAAPTGQAIPVEALTVDGLPAATALPVPSPALPVPSPAPAVAVIPAALPATIPPNVTVPAMPVAAVAIPQAPITFPGQAAAFPTEIALPQEGVFIPPPVTHTFDGPLPAFLAPPAAPGAEETRFAESLPEPVARGSVKPPKVRSKSTQTIIVSTITVILLFATVMFLMGDPSRRFGKKPKSKVPEEENPIARPLDSGPADQSIEDVFARINAASKSGDKKNDSDGSKEKK